MAGGSREVEFLLIYNHEEYKEESKEGNKWCRRPCRVKSQLYPSLPEAITLLASQETLSSSGEQPRAPQRWKNPPLSMTVGKKRCWTISGTIETGFYFCSFLESCSCSCLLLWAWSCHFFIFRAILVFFPSLLLWVLLPAWRWESSRPDPWLVWSANAVYQLSVSQKLPLSGTSADGQGTTESRDCAKGCRAQRATTSVQAC